MRYKNEITMFIVTIIIIIIFNPMNIMVYKLNDLSFSLILFYAGILIASNITWVQQIVHYLVIGNFNYFVFFIGIFLSISVSLLLRQQLFIDDSQWLKIMITHNSTALTINHKIYNKTKNPKLKKLAKNIIDNRNNEIKLMKSIL